MLIKSQKLILIVFLFLSFFAQSQETYSYIFERKFKSPTDLVGYNFRPFKMEIPGTYDGQKLEPGTYSFGILRNRLLVNGDRKIGGIYEINNINSTNYGYKLVLMNARNPSIRGHLKIVLNKRFEAEIVIFKADNKANEIIFHLPEAEQKVINQEALYFTDLREIIVDDVDSLWGSTLQPYMRVSVQKKFQDRIYESDSTQVSFVKEVVFKEKKKKSKKKKRGKMKSEEQQISPDALLDGEMVEEEDYSLSENISSLPAETEKEGKLIESYFVKFRAIQKNEKGIAEDKVWSFPIKEFVEREDASARKNEERYQLVFKVNKKQEIYLYLNGDRTVSSFELDGVKYLMRGH